MDNNNYYNFGICPLMAMIRPNVPGADSCLGEECAWAVRDEHGEQFFGCSLPHLAKNIASINESVKNIYDEIKDIDDSLQR